MGKKSRFKILRKVLDFVPIGYDIYEALEDGVLDAGEIVGLAIDGMDAAGIKGLDGDDIWVEDLDDGGFSINFSAKAKKKLSVEI